TNFTKEGFPSSYLSRHKFVRGFKTGDRVRAIVPAKLKTAGVHVGRVQVRIRGSFALTTSAGEIGDINARYCYLVQRGDGYAYQPGAALPRVPEGQRPPRRNSVEEVNGKKAF
ncbi:MAG TPA: hypothetical protein VIY29_24305, partial [Ktedonobacteraceae bacterium]